MLRPQFILPLANELVVDLFAGGGGASTGIERPSKAGTKGGSRTVTERVGAGPPLGLGLVRSVMQHLVVRYGRNKT